MGAGSVLAVGVLSAGEVGVLTRAERLAATAAVVLAVLFVRWVVRTYRAREDGDFGTMRRLGLSTAIAGATAAGVLALVGLWGLGDELVAAYERLELAEQASNIVLAIVVLGGAYALTDFVGQVIRELLTAGETVSDHQKEVLYRLTQLGIYAMAGLVVIGLFTDNLGSLLVGAGFLGIIVGMAAQKTLGAALAGIVLMFSRPFEVGDWVQIDEHEGTVTDITLVNTRIQSFDGEYVTVPNDEVSGNPIVDRTKKGRYRIEVEVGVDYADDPDRAAGIALEAVEEIETVMDVPSPTVVGKRFADSAVVLGVRFWIDDPSSRKRWRTRTEAIIGIRERFAEEGITIPFPQRTHGTREDGIRVTGSDGAVPASPANGESTDGVAEGGASADGASADGASADGSSADGASADGASTDGSSADEATSGGASTNGNSADGATSETGSKDGAPEADE